MINEGYGIRGAIKHHTTRHTYTFSSVKSHICEFIYLFIYTRIRTNIDHLLWDNCNPSLLLQNNNRMKSWGDKRSHFINDKIDHYFICSTTHIYTHRVVVGPFDSAGFPPLLVNFTEFYLLSLIRSTLFYLKSDWVMWCVVIYTGNLAFNIYHLPLHSTHIHTRNRRPK